MPYCEARKMEIAQTGTTSKGWPVGRKPGARGRAGLIVFGELLSDIQKCGENRKLLPDTGARYGVSAAAISNLAVMLGFIKRNSRKAKAEKREILKRLYSNFNELARSTQGRERDRLKAIHRQAGELRDMIYDVKEYGKPVTPKMIAKMRQLIAT